MKISLSDFLCFSYPEEISLEDLEKTPRLSSFRMSEDWNEKLRQAAADCLSTRTDAELMNMKRRAVQGPSSLSSPLLLSPAAAAEGAFVVLFASPTALDERLPSSFAFLPSSAYRKFLEDIGAMFPALNKRAADDVVTAVVFVQDSTLYHATFVHTAAESAAN